MFMSLATRMQSPVIAEDRLCLLPIKYPSLYGLYQKHLSTFWTPQEIDFSNDVVDWDTAGKNIQEMLKKILSFFAVADGIVMENVSDNFADEVKAPEARCFYAFQNAMESVHVITYNQTIETYLAKDPQEMHKLLSNVSHYHSVQEKVKFTRKWMNAERTFPERLVAFSCVEGILFSSSFALIYWLKDQNKFPGLTFSNELISRDEALHTDFAVALYKLLIPAEQISKSLISEIIHDAVVVEQAFVREAVPDDLPTLSVKDMVTYVQHVGNVLATQYGIELPRVHLPKSLNFMTLINLNQKVNFFEGRNANYAKYEGVAADKFSCTDTDF